MAGLNLENHKSYWQRIIRVQLFIFATRVVKCEQERSCARRANALAAIYATFSCE